VLADRAIAFDQDRLLGELDASDAAWKDWFDAFEASRERIYETRPHDSAHKALSWDQVRTQLPAVFEHTRLKVVNSDTNIGTTVDFAPRMSPDGSLLPPQDCYTILVGGAKLSRGLTIEGLCISYFVRWSTNPTEDTVLQLSRWFGYRGPHLEFCRVFMSSHVYSELAAMHENDLDLRLQLASLMEQNRTPHEAVLVIRSNPRSLPTGKMGDGKLLDIAFSPFNSVLGSVEMGEFERDNQAVALEFVEGIRTSPHEVVRSATGRERGLLSRGRSVGEVVQVLEAMKYSGHNPQHDETALRGSFRIADPARPFGTSLGFLEDPYYVAAYLKAWSSKAAADPKVDPPPSFNFAVSFGELAMETAPFNFPLTNRQVTETGRVIGGWTGRSDTWDGDAFFDSPPLSQRIKDTYSRATGAPGLLLLYIVHKDARGRSGLGVTRKHHSPILGISIPFGGPPFRRTLAARS
jgi:hypothetical protein